MKAREKIKAAAVLYTREFSEIPSGWLADHLVRFGQRIRRQTIREERARNKRVAAMFKKEPGK